MDSNSTILIKVKYGDTLRRFNAVVNQNKQVSLGMDGLMNKITSLFNISAKSELELTYIDEDCDVVTLVDDDDLKNVVTQKLKFLRIDVHCNDKKFVNSCTRSSALSPMSTTKVQHPLPSIKHGAPGMLEDMPQYFREASTDIFPTMSSKASQPTLVKPELTEILNSTLVNPVLTGLLNFASTLGHSNSRNTTGNVIGKGKGPVIGVSSPIDLNFGPSSDSNRFENTAADCKFVRHPIGSDKKAVKESEGKSIRSPVSYTDHCRHPFGSTPNSTDYGFIPFKERSFGGNPLTSFPPMSSYRGYLASPIISNHHLNATNGKVLQSSRTEVTNLCNFCFSEIGDETDYIRKETPESTLYLQKPPLLGGQLKHDSRFVLDVNVSDGTVMAPCTSFNKIWKMQNTGTLMWHHGLKLVWIGGDLLTNATIVELEIPTDGVPVGGMLNVEVAFTAPSLPGRYISYWRMQSPTAGVFGQRIWALIQVDSNMKGSVSNNHQGLNLNMLPESNVPEGPDSVDINVQPCVDSHSMELSSTSKLDTKPVEKMVDEQSEKNEPKIPIDDTLLVPDVASLPVPSETPLSPSVSDDISDQSSEVSDDSSDQSSEVSDDSSDQSSEVSDDISDQSSAVSDDISDQSSEVSNDCSTTPSSSSATDLTPSKGEANANDTLELSLLKEKGFKETNLTKEILRKNVADLEKSLDALCGVSDEDPMLDELDEIVSNQPIYLTDPETQPSQPSYFTYPGTQPSQPSHLTYQGAQPSQPSYLSYPGTTQPSRPNYFTSQGTQPSQPNYYGHTTPGTHPYNYYNTTPGTQPNYYYGAQPFSAYQTIPGTQPYSYYQTMPATQAYSSYALPPFQLPNLNSQSMQRTHPYYYYNTTPGARTYYC